MEEGIGNSGGLHECHEVVQGENRVKDQPELNLATSLKDDKKSL